MSVRRFFLGASLLCAALAVGVAGAAQSAPPAKGPWIGVWKLNVARSSYQVNPPPPDAIRIYEMRQVAPDAFDVIIDFKDPKNPQGPSVLHMETRGARFDGKEYKETGNPIADLNRFHLLGERSYEFVESRGEQEVIRISVEISEDGNTRTSRQSSVGQDGKPIQNVAVWDRVGLMADLAPGVSLPGEAAQPAKPAQHFSFAGKRPTFKEEHVRPEVVVSGANSEGNFSLIDEVWSPSFQVPAHYHRSHAETFYIVSGQVEWTVGGQTHVLKAGDLVHIPAYTVHSVKVVGNEDLRTLMVYQPGGFEEHMWFQESLTPEQLADPRVRKQLAILQDFHLPDANTPLATQPIGHFSFAGKRPSYEDDGTSDVALSSKDSGGRLNIQDEVWEVAFAVGPHFHRAHAETFYVLNGRVEWTAGGETHVLSRGDAVHIPPNTVHSARALDNRPVHTLMFYNPSGYDEHLERQAMYSAAEQQDPAVRDLLRRQGDFNPVRE